MVLAVSRTYACVFPALVQICLAHSCLTDFAAHKSKALKRFIHYYFK